MITSIPNAKSNLGTNGVVSHGKRLLGNSGADNSANNGAAASIVSLDGVTTLTSAAPSFTLDDVGRQITVSGATDEGANGTHMIIEYVDDSNVRYQSQAADGSEGSISWAIVTTGTWFRQDGLWKTFLAYSTDKSAAVGATLDVKIDGCMELAEETENTAYVELATLDQATPHFSVEEPWRYLRARVVDAGGITIQVGGYVQG